MPESIVSLIVPAYDEAECIDALLSDIRAQLGSVDIELIVADGGSMDATRSIAAGYGAKVVSGGTASAGRNNGARAATGSTLVFLDADTRISGSFLETCIAEFRERELDIAAMDNVPSSSSNRVVYGVIYFVHNKFVRLMANVDPHMTSTCFVTKRSVYEELGGFDESVAVFGDSEFAKRAARNGYRFAILNSVKIRVSVRRFEQKGPVRWALTIGWALLRRRLLGETTRGDFYWGATP